MNTKKKKQTQTQNFVVLSATDSEALTLVINRYYKS